MDASVRHGRRAMGFVSAALGVLVGAVGMVVGGCSSAEYATPGPPADMSVFRAAQAKTSDASIREAFAAEPLATFPASIAVVRVQGSGYHNHARNDGYGSGAYSVVTQREVEKDEHYQRLRGLPGVKGVATVNRLLLSANMQTDRDLRAAAASLHADLLLVYTFDTKFDSEQYAGVVSVVTLGLFPTKVESVRSTASAVLLDTRTGYVHALAEGAGDAGQLANAWTSEEAAEDARLRAEGRAFEGLLASFEKAWPGVLAANTARTTTPAAAGMVGHGSVPPTPDAASAAPAK